jgi:DNA-binding HxlR family transcriptional regulator
MSSSVLYERLDELTTARLIVKEPAGRYTLTDCGKSLRASIASLDRWAIEWAANG